MSCKYKNECPSRSGWCDGIKLDFSRCIPFLITAYTNAKSKPPCVIDFTKSLLAKVVYNETPNMESFFSEADKEKIVKVHSLEMPCKHHDEAIIWDEHGCRYYDFELLPQEMEGGGHGAFAR